jgi:hypothetical protein
MSRHLPMAIVALAIAAGSAAGCTTAAPQQPSKQSHHGPAADTLGSPGNPLELTCNQSSSFPNPVTPGQGDVVVGALDIINARDSADPSGAGPTPQPGYKYPIAVAPGAAVTMMIAPPARGHVVIDNPYGPATGVTAATYQACQPSSEPGWTVFVQGFTFTDGRTRGCVPLTVQTGRGVPVRHVTVSLYAGPCTS